MEVSPSDISLILDELRSLRSELQELRAQLHGPAVPERILPEGVEEKPHYTYQEVADAADVSYRTVQGWVASRMLLTIDVGGPRIPRDELERLLTKGVCSRGRKR